MLLLQYYHLLIQLPHYLSDISGYLQDMLLLEKNPSTLYWHLAVNVKLKRAKSHICFTLHSPSSVVVGKLDYVLQEFFISLKWKVVKRCAKTSKMLFSSGLGLGYLDKMCSSLTDVRNSKKLNQFYVIIQGEYKKNPAQRNY